MALPEERCLLRVGLLAADIGDEGLPHDGLQRDATLVSNEAEPLVDFRLYIRLDKLETFHAFRQVLA